MSPSSVKLPEGIMFPAKGHYYPHIILLVIHPMTYSHYIGLLIYHFTEVGKCPTFLHHATPSNGAFFPLFAE